MDPTADFSTEQAGLSPVGYQRRHYGRHWSRALRGAKGDVSRAAATLARAGRLAFGHVGLQVGRTTILWTTSGPANGLLRLTVGGGWWLMADGEQLIARRIPWHPKFGWERPCYDDIKVLDLRRWNFEQRCSQRLRYSRHAVAA